MYFEKIMKKPKQHTKSFYDWDEVEKFISHKLEKNLNDYDNKYGKNGIKGSEYQDYWHWILDHFEIHNGSFFEFDNWLLDPDEGTIKEDWQREITEAFLTEFGDGPERKVTFYVWW